MTNRDAEMSEGQLRLLLESMGEQLSGGNVEGVKVLNKLAQDTVRFRDKLKRETGEILTVSNTRLALEALSNHLDKQPISVTLTSEQKALLQIWIDRLTLF